jgi:hypothetical protein
MVLVFGKANTSDGVIYSYNQGCGSGSGSGLDPDSATLWIRIRIGNPDPGSRSRGKKIKKYQCKNALFSYLKKIFTTIKV